MKFRVGTSAPIESELFFQINTSVRYSLPCLIKLIVMSQNTGVFPDEE